MTLVFLYPIIISTLQLDGRGLFEDSTTKGTKRRYEIGHAPVRFILCMRSTLIPLFASCPAFLMRNEAPRKMKAIRKANGGREN